jgi:hypothetical protein
MIFSSYTTDNAAYAYKQKWNKFQLELFDE